MGKNVVTSQLVDEVLRFGALAALGTATIFAPNAVQFLDKPLRALDHTLTKREREREAMRVIRYMKQKGYLAGDYEHGLQLTSRSQKRLAKIELQNLVIQPLNQWDKRWRMAVYDIPESHRHARRALSIELRRIGCFQLQKSTWITPFPCREEITTLAAHFEVAENVSYFEVINLENEAPLKKAFQKKYPETTF